MKSLFEYEELIIFDCETSGLSPDTNRIIELACCMYTLQNNEYVLNRQYSRLVKINEPLSLKIVNLTGITDQILNSKGISEDQLAEEFADFFIVNSTNKKLFIAYNAPFDINFISRMLTRHGFGLTEKIEFLDVLTIYKDRAKYPHKLENAIEHYQLQNHFRNSHRALDDCIATFEVLYKMSQEYDDIYLYINLFGYNPNYALNNRVSGVRYVAQPYNISSKLYDKI